VGLELRRELNQKTRLALRTGNRFSQTTPELSTHQRQVDAQLELQRTLNARTSFSTSYGVQASRSGPKDVNHQLQLRGQTSPNTRLTLDATIGASYLDTELPENSNWALIGGAGFSLRFKQATLSSRYERSNYRGLVTGRDYTTDTGSFSVSRPVARRLNVSLYGYYMGSRHATGPSGQYHSFLVGGMTGARLRKHVLAGMSGAYYRYERDGVPSSTRPLVTVFLTFH
jgi:hypothetical protein